MAMIQTTHSHLQLGELSMKYHEDEAYNHWYNHWYARPCWSIAVERLPTDESFEIRRAVCSEWTILWY